MRNSEVQRLFNTSAKPLKYLPSYSLQTQVAEFQIVLQNGFMDCTSLPKSWQRKKNIAWENSLIPKRKSETRELRSTCTHYGGWEFAVGHAVPE